MYNRIYKQKQYAADYSRYYGEDENRGMSTGAKVGLGALGTAGAAAGAIAAGRRGFLGAKAMRTINSGWAKTGAMFGHEGMISEGARGVIAAEQLAKGNINRRGANVIRQGDYKKLLGAENPSALYGFKKDANVNQELRKIKDSELSWRNKHEDMVLTGDSARKNRIKKLKETEKIEENNKEADKVKDTVKNNNNNNQGNNNSNQGNKNNNQGNNNSNQGNKNNNQGNKNNNQGNKNNNNQGNKNNNNQGNKNNVQTQSEAAADAAKNAGKNVLPTHTDTRQQDLQNMYRD